MTPAVDNAGEQVLGFVSAAKNLTKIGELTTKIIEIANSSSWRRYTTALGTDKWGECEFDYFLIACGLEWDDVSKVIAWSKIGSEIAPLMDHDAEPPKRRPLGEAAAQWHAPGPETLIQRAARLGWTGASGEKLRAAPISQRVRAHYVHGIPKDEHTKRVRAERIEPKRRHELDTFVDEVEAQLADDQERRYVIDRLRSGKRGRPTAVVEVEAGLSARELADKWGVSLSTAKRRMKAGSG